MNILIICRADHSGAGYALMQAINAHTEHKARHISYKRTWLEYPVDIFQPTGKQLDRWKSWADVYNIHADIEFSRCIKPVVQTYHGSHYRNHWKALNKRDKTYGSFQTCLTIDLSLYGPKWTGRAQPDLSHMWQPADEFTVVHSPTQTHRKGTALVRQTCKELGVKLDVITGVTHAECLKRKARGHVLVDQVGPKALGYGTSGIEAMAMGMPVISDGPHDIKMRMIQDWGTLPFIPSVPDIEDLIDAIDDIRSTAAVYGLEYFAIGRKHWKSYHSPEYVAREFVKVCEEAAG